MVFNDINRTFLKVSGVKKAFVENVAVTEMRVKPQNGMFSSIEHHEVKTGEFGYYITICFRDEGHRMSYASEQKRDADYLLLLGETNEQGT